MERKSSLSATGTSILGAFSGLRSVAAVIVFLSGLLCATIGQAQIVGTAQLNIERRGHTATLLEDGKVLIVGGENQNGIIGQAEVFDPATQTSTPGGSLATARTDHSATRLVDGRVLVIGGRDQNGPLTSTELYDPLTGSFTSGPFMATPRSGHTATVLSNGNVLIAGGDSTGSAEIYDLATQSFSPIAAGMMAVRKFHSAILLGSGQVLIVGGVDAQNSVLNTAEVYDPSSQSFYLPPTDMQTQRAFATLKLLGDGKVQIIGGDAELSMEVFDPTNGIFIAKALLPPNADLLGATLSTQSRAALFSPSIAQDPLLQGVLTTDQLTLLDRADHSITELPSRNQALIAGGVNSAGQVLNSAKLVSSSSASITTDKTDYAPGQIVTIAGNGFQPNERIDIYFHEFPEEYPDVFLSAVANQQGNFVTAEFAPQQIDLGRIFTLTAVGQSSGFTAQTAFKDAKNTDTTIASSNNPSTVEQSVTFTATVTETGGGGGTAGAAVTVGSVTFREGGNNCSQGTAFATNVTLSAAGQATANTTFTTAASRTIRACYNGTGGAAGTQSSDGALTQTVNAGFSVTLDATPISDVTNGTAVLSVTIGAGPATAVTKGELPKVFSNITSGTTVSYSYVSPLVVSAIKQYRWNSSSGTGSASGQTGQSGSFSVTSNSSVSATYVAQYQQSFSQSGLDGAATGTVVTVDGVAKGFSDLPFSKFVDAGATVAYSYSDPVASSDAGKRYRRDSVTGPADGYTVSGANSVTGNYVAQYAQTFAQSGLDADASGTVVTVDGASKVFSNLPFSKFVDAGATVTYSYNDPVTSSVSGKRYRRDSISGPANGYTVSGANTVTGNYVAQYQLTLAITAGVPVGLSNITGGTNGTFYDSGTMLSLSAATPVADGPSKQWRFANWTGDVVSPPNSSNPLSITMNQPRSITANYVVQWLQTFTHSGLSSDAVGTVVTVDSAAKSVALLPFSKFVDQGATVTYSYSNPVASSLAGKRFRLASVTGPSTGYVVMGANTVTGNYVTQYQLTLAANGLPTGGASVTGSNTVVTVGDTSKTAANLPFSDWFDAGTYVHYAFSTPISTVPVSDKQYELTNAASLPASPITVTGPMTITGEYALNIYFIHYLKPLDESTALSYLVNTGKNGRVIPVKVEIFKNEMPIILGDVVMRVAGSNCYAGSGDAPVEEYADAGNANAGTDHFRFADGFWIYNLDTKALGLVNNNCYRLDVYYGTVAGPTAVKLSTSVWAIFKPVR